MKHWKNDHIFRILSDPNSTEDQWLSAIDALRQGPQMKAKEQRRALWRAGGLGLLGLFCGTIIAFLSFVTLSTCSARSELIFSAMILGAFLACCRTTNRSFSFGLNAGILISIVVTPAMSNYWDSEHRIWQAATIVLPLCVYAAWSLMLYVCSGGDKRKYQASPEPDNRVPSVVSPPLTVRQSNCEDPLKPPQKKEHLLENDNSVIPLRSSGTPHLVAFEHLKDNPANSAGKIIQIRKKAVQDLEQKSEDVRNSEANLES